MKRGIRAYFGVKGEAQSSSNVDSDQATSSLHDTVSAKRKQKHKSHNKDDENQLYPSDSMLWSAHVTKEPVRIKERYSICDSWGALVDSKWRTRFESADIDIRKILLLLRARKAAKQAPCTPVYGLPNGLSERAFRWPGSGDFAMDMLRASWRQSSAAVVASENETVLGRVSAAHENFFAILSAYVAEQKDLFEDAFDLNIDEYFCFVSRILGLGKDSSSFKLIASLYYSTTWWVSLDKLQKRWMIHELDDINDCRTGIFERCILEEFIVAAPDYIDEVDLIDLLNQLRKNDIISLFPHQVSAKDTKLSMLAFFFSNGLNLCKGRIASIPLARNHVRLSFNCFRCLHWCHIWMLSSRGYSSGESKLLLTRLNLRNTRFGGCLDKVNTNENTDQRFKQATFEDKRMVEGLKTLENRTTFVLAVAERGKMDEYIAIGDKDNSLLVLHGAFSRVLELKERLELPHKQESECRWNWIELAELDVLVRTCLSGCTLLEREKSFENAIFYLKVLMDITLRAKRLNCIFSEVAIRLSTNQERCMLRDSALKTIEQVFLQDSSRDTMLWPTLEPANLTANRLGQYSFALLLRCAKLSIPPCRWKPLIKEAERLPPKIVSITIFGELDKPKNDLLSVNSNKIGFTRTLWKGSKNVEQVVLDHFAAKSWMGEHRENGLFLSLFKLLFWDIIFDAGRLKRLQKEGHGIFFVELPSDVYDGSWIDNSSDGDITRSRVRDRLASLECKDATLSLLNNVWSSKHGVHVRGVDWGSLDILNVRKIVLGLQTDALRMICSLFAENYLSWCGGLPDLLLWKDTHPYNVRFIEVKGPGDVLSVRQLAWFDKLIACNCDIVVCHVRATNAK